MNEERQRVLQMLKAGRITVEEAEALLEALDEEDARGERFETPDTEDRAPAAAGAAGRQEAPADASTGQPSAEPASESMGDHLKQLRRLIDDMVASVDVDSVVETVRESLRQSRVDVARIKDEVRRAARSAREEGRRAAREARRHGFRVSISRAIDGLWGMSDASGTWTHEADLGAGQRLAIHNIWGDVRLQRSPDARLHILATIRAWGRDEHEAQSFRDQVQITARDEGTSHTVRVEPLMGHPRRFRVDFDVKVPPGVSVEVSQAKGDVEGAGLSGDLVVSVASGDVSVQDHGGAVSVNCAKGDVTVARSVGDAHVDTKHGDVTLREVGGRATASTMHGEMTVTSVRGDVHLSTMHGEIQLEDVSGRLVAHTKNGDVQLRRPAGPVVADFQAARGDVDAQIGQCAPGTTSILSTMSGDVSVQFGEQARCRINARVTSGEITVNAPLMDVRQSRRTLQAVLGSPDAVLELSTVSGDITISAQRIDAHAHA